MLTQSGVKLLDFGLAKLEARRAPLEQQSTVEEKEPLTVEGEILGTLQYMAPEQLEGRDTDARTDVFAFGAMIYEMVTGKKAFQGERSANLIAAILQSEPAPMSSVRTGVPSLLDRVVRRCLAKDPDRRWSAIHDVVLQLEGITDEGSTLSPSVTRRNKLLERVLLVTTVLASILAIFFGFALYRQSQSTAPLTRFEISPPDGLMFRLPGAVSPDGRHIAIVANESGSSKIWLRDLDSRELRPVPGTEGAVGMAFWSPDSRFIGFSDGAMLQKVARSGGQLRQAQPLCAVNAFLSGTWNAEGEIVFTDNISTGGGLYRVSEDGGDAIPVTTLDQARREDRHLWPHFLPDGRHFLYIAVNSEGAGVYVGSLDSGETTHLMDGFLIVNYALGHLLLARAGTLEAIPFDAANLRIEGEPVPIATDLSLAVSSSVNGVVAGIPSGQLNLSTQLVWFDRKGQELGTASPVVRSGYYGPWFSPDEERVVIERHAETGMNLWLLELSRGTTSRFTFDQDSHDQSAVWASDGSSIVYSSSTETGSWSLNLKSSSGSGQAEELLSASDEIYPTDWSPDGPVVIYEKLNQAGNWDVWLLPLIGDREPEPLLETLFDERHAQLSPDGRWITYVSNESGSHEVYVQSFPTGLGKWKISTDGGGQPGWKRDGTEIFYLDPDSNLMAVQVETTSSTLEAALPETLFELSLEPSPLGPFDIRNRYAAAGDGERFLVPTIRNEVPASISVFLNWTSLLEENQ